MSRGGLEVRGVTVRAGDVTIVADAGFHAPAGSITALLGPNGAGKSTLLRAVAGVERTAGTAAGVSLDGDDLLALPRRERARRLALVEQESSTELPLTVGDVVRLGRTPHETVLGGRDADAAAIVGEALATTGMTAFAARDITSLSGGERQRVMLARALAQQPRALILDEPTNHLDIRAQLDALDVLARVAATGTTVVAALHDLTLAAAHADHVVVLAGGSVVAEGDPVGTLTPDLVRDVYGVQARWLDNPLTGRPMLAIARR